MPEFDSYVDVDVYDFVSACNKREIKDLIELLIEDGHISQSAVITPAKVGYLEGEFLEKLSKLSNCYYRLTPEDERTLEKIFQKYI